jgi:hypothetical protein
MKLKKNIGVFLLVSLPLIASARSLSAAGSGYANEILLIAGTIVAVPWAIYAICNSFPFLAEHAPRWAQRGVYSSIAVFGGGGIVALAKQILS